MPVAAREGCKPLFIPQRLWEDHLQELGEYNRLRVDDHGWQPERPTVVCWVYCTEDAAQAEAEARIYLHGMARPYDTGSGEVSPRGRTSGWDGVR